jgi:hypothetical protein
LTVFKRWTRPTGAARRATDSPRRHRVTEWSQTGNSHPDSRRAAWKLRPVRPNDTSRVRRISPGPCVLLGRCDALQSAARPADRSACGEGACVRQADSGGPVAVPPTAPGAVRVEPGQSLALGEHALVGSACVTKFGIVRALGRYRRVRVGLRQSCGSVNCIAEDAGASFEGEPKMTNHFTHHAATAALVALDSGSCRQ